MRTIILAFAIGFPSLCLLGADLVKISQETQRLAQEPSRSTLVWWIPTEWWDLAIPDGPGITDDARARLNRVMDDYLIFVVISREAGPQGLMALKDRATLEANTRLLVGGKEIAPIQEDEMSATALKVFAIMQPSLRNTLGKLGEGLQVLWYPNPPPGAAKISAKKAGEFSYSAFGNRFEWHLPLGSLLPPRIDEKTGQVFPGDYVYNPYTGEKLSEQIVESGSRGD